MESFKKRFLFSLFFLIIGSRYSLTAGEGGAVEGAEASVEAVEPTEVTEQAENDAQQKQEEAEQKKADEVNKSALQEPNESSSDSNSDNQGSNGSTVAGQKSNEVSTPADSGHQGITAPERPNVSLNEAQANSSALDATDAGQVARLKELMEEYGTDNNEQDFDDGPVFDVNLDGITIEGAGEHLKTAFDTLQTFQKNSAPSLSDKGKELGAQGDILQITAAVKSDARVARQEADKVLNAINTSTDIGDVKAAMDKLDAKIYQLKDLIQTYNDAGETGTGKALQKELDKLVLRENEFNTLLVNMKLNALEPEFLDVPEAQRGAVRRWFDRAMRRVNDFMIDLGLKTVKPQPGKAVEALVQGVQEVTQTTKVNGQEEFLLVLEHKNRINGALQTAESSISNLVAFVERQLPEDGSGIFSEQKASLKKIVKEGFDLLRPLQDVLVDVKRQSGDFFPPPVGILSTELFSLVESYGTQKELKKSFEKISSNGKLSDAMKEVLRIDHVTGRASELSSGNLSEIGIDSFTVGKQMMSRDTALLKNLGEQLLHQKAGITTSSQGDLLPVASSSGQLGEFLDLYNPATQISEGNEVLNVLDTYAEYKKSGEEPEFSKVQKAKGTPELYENLKNSGQLEVLYKQGVNLGNRTLESLTQKPFSQWSAEEFAEFGVIREREYRKQEDELSENNEKKEQLKDKTQALRDLSISGASWPVVRSVMRGESVAAEVPAALESAKSHFDEKSVSLQMAMDELATDSVSSFSELHNRLNDLLSKVDNAPQSILEQIFGGG